MADFLQVFYRGADNSLYSFWEQNGGWSNFQEIPIQRIGGVLNGAPVACPIPGTGLVQLFYRGTDNSVYSVWRNTNGSWSDEHHIGGVLNGDPIAVNIPGVDYVIQLFYRGTDNSLYTRWRQQTAGDPHYWDPWSDEIHIGGLLTSDPGASWIPDANGAPVDYMVQLFYQGLWQGQDNSLWSRWRNPDSDGTWSDEQHLGGSLGLADLARGRWPAAKPVAAIVGPVLQVLYQSPGSSLCYQQRNPNGSWSGEIDCGGACLSDPAVAWDPGSSVMRVFYQSYSADRNGHGLVTRSLDPWADPMPTWAESPEVLLGGNYNAAPYTNTPVVVQRPDTGNLQVFYSNTHSLKSMTLTGPPPIEQDLGGGFINGQFTVAVISG